MSPRNIGGSTGSRSAKPLIDAKPAYPSASVPKPGLCRYGPVCPQPEMRAITSDGRNSSSTSGPSPICSSTPGLKLSTNTSASRTSRFTMSMPSAERRSTHTLRLLRPYTFQLVLTPPAPTARSVSPRSFSTFTTSAPKSAS
ncbi:hypothetical protein BO06_3510 [Burkholderia mallei]|nr:hypothetical protein DM55_3842 [Burkholderia mallei]AIO56022.1 hypothetical protein DM78_4761 [Burkholderia mallei]AIO60070.1 hypothetical protein DM76_4539 [Burkholderia mallei]AIP74125.1 hypothetical protein DM51_3633 [Burkholderia mallei]AJX50975.1 hypothetical protein BM47_3394 [Burkholderia mallei]